MKAVLIFLALLVVPAEAKPLPWDQKTPITLEDLMSGRVRIDVEMQRAKRYKVKRAKVKKSVSRAPRLRRALPVISRPLLRGSRSLGLRPHLRVSATARPATPTTIPLPLPRSIPDLARDLGIHHIEIEPVSESLGEVVRLPIKIVGNLFRAYEAFMVKPVGRCQEFETVDPRVKRVVNDAARHFQKPALATSCYRSPAYNRAVRGAHRSQHIARKALDFKIPGVDKRALARYVRNHPIMRKIGGVGVYRSDFIHADVGPKRNWDWTRKRRYAGA